MAAIFRVTGIPNEDHAVGTNFLNLPQNTIVM
ncbi:hypothetical protein MTO96_050193, partial [Rhipicephalus appendiculatus]